MDLIDRIYEALEDDDVLEALPAMLAEAVGSRSCTLMQFSPEFKLEDAVVSHFDSEMLRYYWDNNLQFHDAWTKTNLNVFGLNNTQRHTDHLPVNQFRNSFFYNEFIRRFGDDSAYCLGFISTRPDGGYVLAGQQKALTDKDFTDEQVAKWESVRPHLTRMLVLRRKLVMREAMAAGALLGIDSIEDAYLVVREDRRIVFANAAAELLLLSGEVIRSTAGRLTLNNDAGDDLLSQAIFDAWTNKAESRVSFLLGEPGESNWRFTVVPKTAGKSRLLLVWIDRGRPATGARSTLRQLYGLSDAEIRVAEANAEGHSAAEIADRLDITVATVRTHLQHLFRKTGTSKATQLAKLVLTLPKL